MSSKILILTLSVLLFASCEKYKDFDNAEVIENSYSGSIVIDNDSDPDGDFTGNGDSGTYAFAWVNTKEKAKIKLSIDNSASGSVQIKLNDAKGKEKFSKSLTGSDTEVSFEDYSEAGKSGTWKITVVFNSFKGDGSFEIDPAD